MKLTTLEAAIDRLHTMDEEILVPPEIAEKALRAVRRMVE